ncbi:class I SAM-dependent methyltransferase [Roseicitreum antarcticum]|uniref:class I SAM-dependent methyltransferase n=1 Tax=Roseicitreum antarcticum TaxID=564137 RepID=UPI003F746B75
MPTPLADILVRRIRATGPISVAEYMAECLLHPQHGYYSTRDPFGQAGDFTTAPEISQMYGEVLGLALAQSWLDQGAPAPFTLAEPGPGRGTLMADILRATARVPGFHAGARLHLVEASPPLRALQAQTLAPFSTTCATPVWHDTIDTLPDAPLFLIANEFFDALPVRQFIRAGKDDSHGAATRYATAATPYATKADGAQAAPEGIPDNGIGRGGANLPPDLWHERVIGLRPQDEAPAPASAPASTGTTAPQHTTPAPPTSAAQHAMPDPAATPEPAAPDATVSTSPPALCFGLTPAAPRAGLAHRLQNTRPGDLVEICPALPGIVSAIADRIARHGGVALIVDYGDEVSLGDTLQALRHHAADDPLAHPGQADLTAHVDFDAIRRAATAPAPTKAAPDKDTQQDTAAKRPPPAAGAAPHSGAQPPAPHPRGAPTPPAAATTEPAASSTSGPRATRTPTQSAADAPPTRPGVSVTPVTPQGMLLERLGITARARALAQPLTGAALDSHIRAHRRLTHPAEMGTLFKAIALYPRSAPQPPGFAP